MIHPRKTCASTLRYLASWARRHELLSNKDKGNLSSILYQPQRPHKCQERAMWSIPTQVVDVALWGQGSYWTTHVGISSSFNHRRLQNRVGTQQDLATPHLMHNCGKRILLLHCKPYVCLCVCEHAYAIWLVTTCLHVRFSWYEYTWFEITRAMPGYARVCRYL